MKVWCFWIVMTAACAMVAVAGLLRMRLDSAFRSAADGQGARSTG